MDDIKWIIGTAVTVSIAYTIALIGAFRNLSSRISHGDGDLHKRVDRVKDDYVRRDDLNSHLDRMDKNVEKLRDEIQRARDETNQRLDNLISTISGWSKTGGN